MHAPPLPHTPFAMHPPLPCTPPSPCMPPSPHTPLGMHPLHHACPQPQTLPGNHTCPLATTHAPLATTHAPHPWQPCMPPSNRACPPHQQPCMPPRNHAHPPPLNRMTNWCKNITLPQTSFAGGKNPMQRLQSVRVQGVRGCALIVKAKEIKERANKIKNKRQRSKKTFAFALTRGEWALLPSL